MDPRIVRRFLGFLIFFVVFVFTGLIALKIEGGGTGRMVHDAYRIIAMFALNGDWAFEEGPLLHLLSFIAPLATVVGIVELLGRSVVARINRDWKLFRMRDHVVVFGLNQESLLLLQGISRGSRPPGLIVVGDPSSDEERNALSKLGAVVLENLTAEDWAFSQALVERADVLISFLSDTDEAITLLTRLDAYLASRVRRPEPIDLWIRISDHKLGDQLAEYFGYGDLQERLHPRFFSLEETSARRLWRKHPLDQIAEGQGQDHLHLCVYGFNHLASQIMVEAVRQSRPGATERMKITVLTDDVETHHKQLLAWRPGLFQCADVTFQDLPFHRTGVSNSDYSRLPLGGTAHVVCHDDPTAAAATALSLRRLLLMKPPGTDQAEARRLNAPVMVRFDEPTGIGQLLSGVQGTDEHHDSSWPDGVEVFGGYDEMLVEDMRDPLEPTVIDTAREAIARHIHISYQMGLTKAAKVSQAEEGTPLNTSAERSWRVLAPEFRDSCRHAADHLWTKARSVGARIVYQPHDDRSLTLEAPAISRLTAMEHQRWMHERFLAGWTYAEKRVDAAKQHPLLKPHAELSESVRAIDKALVERMDGALHAGRLAIRKEYVIGITGHRQVRGRSIDPVFVRQRLEAEMTKLKQTHPDRALSLLTPLATGADSLAAEAAMACDIPYTAVLPLPFEASRPDYEGDEGGIEKFLTLVAGAERVIELPLIFGDLADVAHDASGHSEARDRQYALAGGYIARRCQTLLAIWDGLPPRGFGGTATIVGWAKDAHVPEEFALSTLFTPPQKRVDVRVIEPEAAPNADGSALTHQASE